MAPLVGKLRVNLGKFQRGLVIAAERAQNIIKPNSDQTFDTPRLKSQRRLNGHLYVLVISDKR